MLTRDSLNIELKIINFTLLDYNQYLFWVIIGEQLNAYIGKNNERFLIFAVIITFIVFTFKEVYPFLKSDAY